MANLPKIGMRLHGGLSAKHCIEMAQVADINGFASLWFAENPFNRGVLPAVTGAVLATKNITVGVGCFNPYNRHPTLIAMEMGALDELAEGRTALGIGSGIADRIGRMGLSYAKPLSAVRDAITVVRGMMHGDSVTHEGAVFPVKNAKLEFAAPRPDYPIYMAAMGEKAVTLSGEIADGLMISNMCPPGYTVGAVERMRAGAAAVGRAAPATVVQYVQCAVAKDRAAARNAVKLSMGKMLAEYWALGERSQVYRDSMFSQSGIPDHDFIAAVNRLKAGDNPVDVLDDRFVDAYSISGNIDDYLAGVARFAQAGVTELVVTFVGHNPVDDIQYLGDVLKGQKR